MANFDITINPIGDPGLIIDDTGIFINPLVTRDSSAPTISTPSPAPASTLTRYQPITFTASDPSPGFGVVTVFVKYIGDDTTYLIHDGTSFKTGWTASSTRTPSGSPAVTSYAFSIVPDAGWLADIQALTIIATDADGNTTTASHAWTGPSISASPTITNMTPANGTQLATRNTPISFDVTDVFPGLRQVAIWLKYVNNDDVYLVYDGTDFTARFSDYSTVSTITNGKHFSILDRGGWQGDIEELWVSAVDQAGNLEGV